MKRKLDTRFPAARIKKIMQADEDVGKIAMAVPLLVSKALELFLQDLCDRTYAITLMRGAKTVNSLHLKQCVLGFDVFDFLREIVEVPDLGGSDAAGEDRSVSKRRKVVDNKDNARDDQSKSRKHEIGRVSSCGRGRGRGGGRGRGRGGRIAERERAACCENFEDDPDISHFQAKHTLSCNRLDDGVEYDQLSYYNPAGNIEAPVRDFDLNVDLNDNGDSTIFVASACPNTDNIPEKDEECPGWSPSEIDKMAIDPIVLSNLNKGIDEEDYED